MSSVRRTLEPPELLALREPACRRRSWSLRPTSSLISTSPRQFSIIANTRQLRQLLCREWITLWSMALSSPTPKDISYASLRSHHGAVSYTHLRAHETRHDLVCRLLLEKKKKK